MIDQYLTHKLWAMIFVSALLCTAHIASAQKGAFEVRADLGYGLPTSEGTMTTLVPTSSSANVDVLFYSYGAGLNISASGTYFFGDHIGAALELGYLNGSTVNAKVPVENGGGGLLLFGNFAGTGTFFSATPSLVLSLNHEKINPYARFGVVVASATVTQSVTEEGSGAYSGTSTDVYTGNVSLGLYAAFGVQFYASDKVSLYAELFDRNLSFAPTLDVNTQAFDGQVKNPDYKMVKVYTGEPGTEPTENLPFSSIGLKIGVAVKIGGQ